jgi:hypothetical protein
VPSELPIATAEFIRRYVDSIEYLEVLLLLRQSPERSWTAEMLDAQIRSNPESIRRRLDQMLAHGLVVRGADRAGYEYRPATAELDQRVQELSGLYRERRVAVIEHVFAERPSPIQGFADSFRIRKTENDG